MGFMQKQVFRLGFSLLVAFWLALGALVQPAAALTDEQKLVSEVWRIVNRTYLDETFNHQNWSQARQKALEKPLKNNEAAYAAIQKMLKTLGDPFTRFLYPQQYRSLQVSTSGELTGVGLQIALNPCLLCHLQLCCLGSLCCSSCLSSCGS